MDHKNMSTQDLQALSEKLQAEQDQIREQRNTVNKELAFRDNLELRARALKGMSAEEVRRVLEMSQDVSGAGGVPSGEAVEGTGQLQG
jgi:hypothetical protein